MHRHYCKELGSNFSPLNSRTEYQLHGVALRLGPDRGVHCPRDAKRSIKDSKAPPLYFEDHATLPFTH
jgi:hypothetical protein